MTEKKEQSKEDSRKISALEIIAESNMFSQEHPEIDSVKWEIYRATNYVNDGFVESDAIASGSNFGAEALSSLALGIKYRADIKGDFGKSEKMAKFLNIE